MGCPKGSLPGTWSAPFPMELSSSYSAPWAAADPFRSPSAIHWSLVDTGILPTAGQCSALSTRPHPHPLSQHSTLSDAAEGLKQMSGSLNPALPLSGCVTVDKSLNLTMPQFPGL